MSNSHVPDLREQMMNVEREMTTRITAGREVAFANGLSDFDIPKFVDWLQFGRLGSLMGIDLVDADEHLRGTVIYSFTKGPGDVGQIDFLWCHTDVRGRGNGEMLLTHAVSNLREMKASTIRLSVGAENLGACRLYERTGWIKRATRNRYCVYERGLETLDAR